MGRSGYDTTGLGPRPKPVFGPPRPPAAPPKPVMGPPDKPSASKKPKK